MNNESTIHMISIESIIPNRFQPRLTFDEQGLNELASSIKEHGIIQPIVLRSVGDKYEIIAGERRYKAASMAGLTEVPAIISNLDDNKSAEVALVENVQRRNLTSIEEAKSYKKILDKGYLTQEQLASKMGISQSSIANKLRLLNLTENVQGALMSNLVSERHARSLLQITDPDEQNKMLNRIISERLTVRQLDEELKNLLNPSLNDVEEQSINDYASSSTSDKTEIIDLEEQTSTEHNDAFPVPESLDIENSQMDEVSIETLDFELNPEPNIEEIKETATDIIPKITNKVFNLFEQSEFPSLEDEIVNMNTDVGSKPGFNPFVDDEDESILVEPASDDLKEPDLAAVSVIPIPEVVEPKKKINPNDIPSVAEAYHDLEEEIKAEGYKITSEEFDFEDLYQIIIKIDKQSE